MQKTPLILKRLSIRKMPGLTQGLPEYENFAGNINIIAGPNASGKSSTARIIQQIIWHNKTQGIQAESSLLIDKIPWDIKIDSNNISIQRNGVKDELTGLPAAEDSGRYMLALHELFNENEGNLAKKIVKESIGGVDLDEAKNNLGYSDNIKIKSVNEYNEYEKAKNKYNEIRQKQLELKKDEQQLDKLTQDKQDAEEAQSLKDFYEKAGVYIDARFDLERKKEEFNKYPPVLEKMTGEEYKKTEELEKAIESCKTNIETAEKEITKNKETLSNLQIPETGANDKTLNELEERIDTITDIEKRISETENNISQFRNKELEALKSIDETTDPSSWNGIQLDDVAGLDKFLNDTHKTLSEKKYLETELGNLKNQLIEETADSDNINNAITTLSYWLQEQKSQTGMSKKWLIGLPVAGVITAFATYFSLIAAVLVVAFLFAIPAIYIYTAKPKKESGLRKSDFEKSGLQPPSEWNIKEVTNRIDELIKQLNIAKEKEEIKHKIERIEKELRELQPVLDQINHQYNEWHDKLNIMPDFPKDNLKNYSGMYWFLIHVKNWQHNHSEAQALKASKEKMDDVWEKNMQKVNSVFSKYNAENANDAIQAKAIFKNLKNEEEIRREAIEKIKSQEQIITDNQTRKEEETKKLEDIYKKLEKPFGQKNEVKKLLDQLEYFNKAKEEHNNAKVMYYDREKTLKAHSLYDKYAKDAENLKPDEIQKLIRENSEKANELDNINKTITEIQTRVNTTKKNADLENALKNNDEALNNLEELYKNNLSSITGNLITDKLKSFTRDKNRPKVFDNAKKLLNQITNGRYDLILDEQDEAAFRAYDNVLKKGQPLDELSTGTRIQLLLAVRLAFIETMESSVKLPVIADELLANSDDFRAKAIIEALIEISRNGRQVFYFTAQDDEVAKWRSYLEDKQDIDHKTITLAGIKNEQTEYDKTGYEFGSIKFVQQIPEPDGITYNEYGKQIGVDKFDILTQEPEQLHLWYLFENNADNDILYNFLILGIKQWGQLKSFLNNGGKIEGLNDNMITKIHNKVELLEKFRELYRKGRPLPINKEILEQSGTITPKFMDAVTSKLKDLNNNPKKLIEALNNREVPRIQQSKIDELEQHLLDKGFMDNSEPMSKNEILLRLQAFISTKNMDGSTAGSFLNKVC